MKTKFFLATLLLFSFTNSALSAPNEQVGDIAIDSSVDDVSPYNKAQDQSIESLKALLNVTTAPSIPTSALTPLNDNQLGYLNGAYLYCTVNTGTCPALLESLYEMDLINAKISGTVDCPNLATFWRQWIKSDMETRQKYLVKMSFMTATSEFTNKQRPRFIKCKESIQQDLTASPDAKAFFSERYKEGNTHTAAIQKTVSILETLKEKNINVFNATGATPAKKTPAAPTKPNPDKK